jgi:hypothetical protein
MGWIAGGFKSWQGLGIFLFTTKSELALGPTQPTIQWVPGSLSLGGKAAGVVKLTTHLHLMPRSRICGAMTPLPNMPPWPGAQLKKNTGTALPYLTLHYR